MRRFACIRFAAVCTFMIAIALVLPVIAAAVTPAIYYAPHPDDDTIGMAGSIRRHIDGGRPVYVVLLTDGEESGTYTWWRYSSGWASDRDGDGDIDKWDFGLARRAEFKTAMTKLGVTKVFYKGGISGFHDKALSYTNVRSTAQAMESSYGPGVSHKTVMKYTDGIWNHVGDYTYHIDHTNACNALNNLADYYGYDCRFYKVGVYKIDAASSRWAPHIETQNASQETYKRQALYYGYVSHTPTHGIGYESMLSISPNFYTNCYYDYHEYMVKPTEF